MNYRILTPTLHGLLNCAAALALIYSVLTSGEKAMPYVRDEAADSANID